MLRASPASLVLLACACSRPNPTIETDNQPLAGQPTAAPSVPAPTPTLPGSHVVVASGAHFYADAQTSEPIASRSFLGDEVLGTIAANHVGWVMRLDRLDGERVLVSTLADGDPEQTCGRGLEGLEQFELRWWVDRSSLLSVTTQVTRLDYADGSSLRLPAGIPILPADADRPRRVSAWGFELAVGDNQPATDLAFEPAALPPLEDHDSLPKAALMLAGAALDISYFLARPGQTPPPISVRSEDGGTFVRLRGNCVEVEAFADPNGMGGYGGQSFGSISGGGYGGGPEARLFAVEAEVPVHWPDGRVAGRTREAARLFQFPAPGQGHCSYFPVGGGSRDIVLCFAETDVREVPLGKANVEAVRMQPEPLDVRRLTTRINVFAQGLRAPCLSHALELDEKLDLRVNVTLEFDPGPRPPKVSLKPRSGKLDETLRSCIEAQLAKFSPADLVGASLNFELRLSAN